MSEKTFPFGKSGTITTNVEGFNPLLGAEGMAAAMVAAGLMTQDEADAALERRRQRRALASAQVPHA